MVAGALVPDSEGTDSRFVKKVRWLASKNNLSVLQPSRVDESKWRPGLGLVSKYVLS